MDGGHDCGGDAAVAAADGGQHAAAPEPADVERQAEGWAGQFEQENGNQSAQTFVFNLKGNFFCKFLAGFAVMGFNPRFRVT